MRTPIHNVEAKRDFAAQMRRNPTVAEATLWYRLKNKQTGFKFHRQSLQRGYILDFYCPKLKLAIEVDGSVHNLPAQAAADALKEAALTDWGIKVLRFTNQDVMDFMSVVMARIEATLTALSGNCVRPGETTTSVTAVVSCGNVENRESSRRDEWAGLKAVLSRPENLCRPKQIPEDQRITREAAEEIVGACKKLLRYDRNRSFAFTEDNRTMQERAFDQKYRLEQWLKKHPRPQQPDSEAAALAVAKGLHIADPLKRQA